MLYQRIAAGCPAEKAQHGCCMQVLLAEKDAELRRLAQRIERMEARRGAMDELQQLDALEARLRVCPGPQVDCGCSSGDSTVKKWIVDVIWKRRRVQRSVHGSVHVIRRPP